MKKLSVVIPVYQNELNLRDTIPSLLTLEEKIAKISLELVFVDDGSTDKSYEILKKYQKQDHRIKLLKFTKNFGQTPAIQAGLREATGDCVGIISADLQEPYELFIEMVNHWIEGAKFIIGEREDREENFVHRFFSNLYWAMIRKIALKGFPKGGYDFCLMDRQLVNIVNHSFEKNTSIFPLIYSLGFNPVIINIKRTIRRAGTSQWTLSKKVNIFLDTAIGFSYFPIRFVSYVGLMLAFLSLLLGSFFIYSYVVHYTRYPGWTTITVLILFLSSAILTSLGIIGEYLWRILDETRKRPGYVIDKKQ